MDRVIANHSHASVWMAKRSRFVHANKLFPRCGSNDQSAASLRRTSRFDHATKPKMIGFILFDQMATAELMGPVEAFFRPTIPTENHQNRRCYQVVTIGLSAKPCVTESGIIVKPQVVMEHAPVLDTLVVPGGSGIRNPRLNKKIAEWLSYRAPVTRRTAAIGTGIYALAATGLLNGRHVVTHWRLAQDVASRFPGLHVNPSNLFASDGTFYTCAGGASAVDLSLHLVEEDYGPRTALTVARDLVMYTQRAGGQEQFSEPLRFQIQSTDRFSEMAAWIAGHLHEDLSVDVLAERASCSRRHFCRLFKKVFGSTPAHYVEELRLKEARNYLLVPRNSLKAVAALVGFKSVDAFSRAFARRFRIRPDTYRRRFQPLA
jgi:transcriptional regulator GlxA family with amidase domain